jgi:ribosomal protein S18 acetylase RimI-like enzyme
VWVSDNLWVRPARAADAAAIAGLLVEGFGHEYGGLAGHRMMERIHALPGRLTGIVVLESPERQVVAMAGMRTREVRGAAGWAEDQVIFDELGIGRAIWLELRATLSEPPPYQPRGDEAYIYNVVVTKTWRGRGAGDRLLSHLHAEAERRGKRRVLLEVVATNMHARRLYERQGYKVERARRGLLALLRLGVPARLLMVKTLSR